MAAADVLQGGAADILRDKLFANVPEAAQVLRYDERTIRSAIAAGEIPAVKAGAQWRIPTAWLREQALLGGGDVPAA